MTKITRRDFLQTASAAALAAMSAGAATSQPTAPGPWSGAEKRMLNIGIVGVGGRGWDHVREVHAIPEANIVALCDVDKGFLENAARHVPSATTYVDFRDMLGHPHLDAVLCATPDHSHAVICSAALKSGKHVYCEKPLTYTIDECRTLINLAKSTGLVTQVGMQVHSYDNYRRVVEVIQSGAIGPVRDVHVWIERLWPDVDMSTTQPPPNLNYDLWLGPVEQLPYRPGWHPAWWRRWSRFSNGILGDMACHYMDVAFWALKLRHPNRIEIKAAKNRPPEVCPDWRVALYDYPARGELPPVRLYWYDGGKRPLAHPSWKLEDRWREGVMFVGDEGMLFTNYWDYRLYPEEKFKDFKAPTKTIPSSPGIQKEWVLACLKKDPSAVTDPFDYGGTVTETALLGTVAMLAGKPIEWDGANMRIPNVPEAEKFLKSAYRAGWTL